MANTIGTAYVQIEPTTAGITESLEKEFASTGKNASNAFGSALKGVGTTMAAIGGAAASMGAALYTSANATATTGDNIDKMSQKLGVSSTFYQEWDAVLQHSGTSMDSMKTTFKTLANAVQDGSADQVAAFEAIGLSMEDLQSMSTEEVFASVITGLQGMEEGTERTALASDLLGKGATELGALLNTSAEDTQGMIDTVHELGGVMSEDAVKNAAAFKDSLQNLQTAFTGVKNKAIGELLPSFTLVMDGISGMISGQEGADEALSQGIESLADSITSALPGIIDGISTAVTSIAEIAPQILKALGEGIISSLPTLLPTLIDLVLQIGLSIIELLPSLITSISQALVTAIPLLIEQLPTIITQIVTGLLDNLPILLEAILQIMVAVGQALIEAIPTLLEQVPIILTALAEKFKECVELLKDVAPEMVNKIKKSLEDSWSKVKDIVQGLVRDLKDKFIEKVEGFKDIGKHIVDGIKEGIRNAWNSLTDWLTGLCGDLVQIVKNALGIASPSKVFAREVGQWIPKGIAVGIENGMGELDKAVEDMAYSTLDNTMLSGYTTSLDSDNFEGNTRAIGGYNQTVNIYSPTELSPSEVARQTRNSTRDMILQLRTV